MCDGDTGEEFVQLSVVVTNSQLKADDSCFLIVSNSVARQLDRLYRQDLSAQILESCSQVHRSTVANSIAALDVKYI